MVFKEFKFFNISYLLQSLWIKKYYKIRGQKNLINVWKFREIKKMCSIKSGENINEKHSKLDLIIFVQICNYLFINVFLIRLKWHISFFELHFSWRKGHIFWYNEELQQSAFLSTLSLFWSREILSFHQYNELKRRSQLLTEVSHAHKSHRQILMTLEKAKLSQT